MGCLWGVGEGAWGCVGNARGKGAEEDGGGVL